MSLIDEITGIVGVETEGIRQNLLRQHLAEAIKELDRLSVQVANHTEYGTGISWGDCKKIGKMLHACIRLVREGMEKS